MVYLKQARKNVLSLQHLPIQTISTKISMEDITTEQLQPTTTIQVANWIFMAVLPILITRNIVKDMRLDIVTKGDSIYEGNSEVIRTTRTAVTTYMASIMIL